MQGCNPTQSKTNKPGEGCLLWSLKECPPTSSALPTLAVRQAESWANAVAKWPVMNPSRWQGGSNFNSLIKSSIAREAKNSGIAFPEPCCTCWSFPLSGERIARAGLNREAFSRSICDWHIGKKSM